MFELLTILIVVWAAKAATDKARKEYRGVRDHHAANLARENPGWHPARIKRHAALRAQAHWWNELSHHTGKRWQPLPSFRAAFGDSRLRAKAEAAEAHADGAESRHALRERVRAAAARTEAVKAASGVHPRVPLKVTPKVPRGVPLTVPPGVHPKVSPECPLTAVTQASSTTTTRRPAGQPILRGFRKSESATSRRAQSPPDGRMTASRFMTASRRTSTH